MTARSSAEALSFDPEAAGRHHFILRFGAGTAAAFALFETMDWQPSALAAVLTGVLLGNLTAAPPFKVGAALILIMYLFASMAYFFTVTLYQIPHILFGVIGLILFLAFAGLAQGRAQLPLILLLLCITLVPVVTLTHPDAGLRFREILVRGMAAGVIFTYIAHAVWPRHVSIPRPPPQTAVATPMAAAALGTAIVLPLMLIYWLFGLTDAIPVLLTTVLLVAKMEEERSGASAIAKMAGNFLGGFIALAAYALLQIAPSFTVFALILFIISCGFGSQIVKGGKSGGDMLLAFNATMIILGILILKGPANSGSWLARLVQFAIACTFAVGLMALLWPRMRARARTQEHPLANASPESAVKNAQTIDPTRFVRGRK